MSNKKPEKSLFRQKLAAVGIVGTGGERNIKLKMANSAFLFWSLRLLSLSPGEAIRI